MIFECGELTGDEAVLGDAPKQADALGDSYEDYPEDEATGSSEGLTAERVVRIAADCREYGSRAFKAGN